jgi:hypothetical protein
MIDNQLNYHQQQECVSDSDNDNSSQIGPHDVLLGRGGAANNHLGNRLFRSIILQHQLEYLNAKKLEKADVARKVVVVIHSQGGRFLRRIGKDKNVWEEVSLDKAQGKASQALREGLDVRHTQLRIKSNKKKAYEASTNSTSKQRKQYTIRKDITHGNVITIDENEVSNTTSNCIDKHASDSSTNQADIQKQLEEYVAEKIANLSSSCGKEIVA